MATIGGGSFFGKVGSFEKGYEFDAMILDDSNIRHPQEISTRDRLERLVYLSDDRNLVGEICTGTESNLNFRFSKLRFDIFLNNGNLERV